MSKYTPIADRYGINHDYPSDQLYSYTRFHYGRFLLLDLDGTIRNDENRLHLLPNKYTLESFAPNYNAAYNKYQLASKWDLPMAGNIQIIKMMQKDPRVKTIILSAATGSAQLNTMKIAVDQMERWGVKFDLMVLRHPTDQRTPNEQKLSSIKDLDFPDLDDVYAMDDNPSICQTFREFGITTMQMAWGGKAIC